jgi:hypothetical protein
MFNRCLGEDRAAGKKSLVNRQQLAKYCPQLPSRLRGQQAQRLLPRTDSHGPILLA